MSLESVIEALDSTVDSLDDTVSENNRVTNVLAQSVAELAKVIRDDFNDRAVSLDAPEATASKPNWSGFAEGDEVVYIASMYPRGLRARVKAHLDRPTLDGEVPVVRADNGRTDVFPARGTVLALNLSYYMPEPPAEEWTKPDGKPDWNLRILKAAAEDGFAVEFTYEKPIPALRMRYAWEQPRKVQETKRCTISKVNSLGPNDADSRISAYDLDKNEPRTFRLDRIIGNVIKAEEN